MKKALGWVMRAKREVATVTFDYDETILGPRDIAVRTDFTAVSPGTECANYLALDPDVLTPGKWCTYPWTPGYAGVGTVIGLGAAVSQYQVGDRVVGQLQHRSYQTVSVDGLVVPAHPEVALQHAAYTRLLGIAMTTLQWLRHDPLGVAGVWGLGTIGNFVAQFLHSAGYRVIGIDPVSARRDLVVRCGIREMLDPGGADFAGQIQQRTGGEGLDVAVDTTGRAASTVTIPALVRWRGQMILMTHWRSQPLIDASPLIRDVFCKGITLQGAHDSSPGGDPWTDAAVLYRRKMRRIQHHLAAGQLRVGPMISHVVSPTQCKEVYEGLTLEPAKWWGVVVDWSQA